MHLGLQSMLKTTFSTEKLAFDSKSERNSTRRAPPMCVASGMLKVRTSFYFQTALFFIIGRQKVYSILWDIWCQYEDFIFTTENNSKTNNLMLRRLSLSRQKSTVQSPPPPGSPGGESPSGKHRRSVAATLNGIILKMPLGSGDIFKKGIVLKRGRNRLYHPWYLNSVVVTDQNLLLYFDGETLKGKVSLQGTSVRILSPQEITGKPYGLEISNVPSKKMLKEDRIVFVVGSEHEATEWLNAFETAQRMYMSRSTTKYESFGVSLLGCHITNCVIDYRLLLGHDAKTKIT